MNRRRLMGKDNRWVYEMVSDLAWNVTTSTMSSSDKTYAKYTGFSWYNGSMDNMRIPAGSTAPSSNKYMDASMVGQTLLCTKFKINLLYHTDDHETYRPYSNYSSLVLTFQDGKTEQIVAPNIYRYTDEDGVVHYEDKSRSTKYCDITFPSNIDNGFFQIFIKVKDGCPAITGVTVPYMYPYYLVPAANYVSYVSGGGKLTLFKRILNFLKSLVKKGGEVC